MQPFSLTFAFKFISTNHILKSENQILLNEEKKNKASDNSTNRQFHSTFSSRSLST